MSKYTPILQRFANAAATRHSSSVAAKAAPKTAVILSIYPNSAVPIVVAKELSQIPQNSPFFKKSAFFYKTSQAASSIILRDPKLYFAKKIVQECDSPAAIVQNCKLDKTNRDYAKLEIANYLNLYFLALEKQFSLNDFYIKNAPSEQEIEELIAAKKKEIGNKILSGEIVADLDIANEILAAETKKIRNSTQATIEIAIPRNREDLFFITDMRFAKAIESGLTKQFPMMEISHVVCADNFLQNIRISSEQLHDLDPEKLFKMAFDYNLSKTGLDKEENALILKPILLMGDEKEFPERQILGGILSNDFSEKSSAPNAEVAALKMQKIGGDKSPQTPPIAR